MCRIGSCVEVLRERRETERRQSKDFGKAPGQVIWSNLYRGLMMGISDLVPGVSGGTIAVVLGIYDQLLAAISGLFSREWSRHIGFLLPLGMGVGIALLGLSRVIQYLLDNHFVPTRFFFLGLILGVLPLLLQRVDARRNFQLRHIIVLLVAAALVGSMALLNPDESTDPTTSLTLTIGLGLFFAGWLASMAMLLPGISGSLVLLIIGVYPTAIEALSSLNIPVIAVIGAGVATGVIVSSKVLRYLITTYPVMMYTVIIGLVTGSVFVVYPGLGSVLTLVISAVTFLLGFGLTVFIGSRSQATESAYVPSD